MTYKEFNQKIFHFYQARSSSSFCILSITKKELEDIIPIDKLGAFDELKRPWRKLLAVENSIPQYFGLIAIQCYAASLMRRDELKTEAAYRIRLCEILCLADNQDLQSLFKGQDTGDAVQEEIWYSAKKYLKDYFQQELEIPEKTKSAGRFVQYPKSQALLNLEDLKRFTPFFSDEFVTGEKIPYHYFRDRIEAWWFRVDTLTSRTLDIIIDSIPKKEKCWQQLYEYFNSWDGTIYAAETGTTSLTIKHIKSAPSHGVLLSFENRKPEFYLIDNDTAAVIEPISPQAIFTLPTIAIYHSGLFIFSEIDYPDEYESNRFFYENATCYLLLDKKRRNREYQLLEKISEVKYDFGDGKILYAYHHSYEHQLLQPFVQLRNPVTLIGGIRTSRKKEYLEGFGPTIACSQSFRVIYDNSSCEYNASAAMSGLYRIRVDAFKDVEFSIVKPSPICTPIVSKNKGWNTLLYEIDKTFHIEGLHANNGSCAASSKIREWISVNLYNKRKRSIHPQALLRAINNSKL